MDDNLKNMIIEMYKNGATGKSIKRALKVGESKLKAILNEHTQSVRLRALTMYDNDCRDDAKEHVCSELNIKMLDLDEWLRYRKFEEKVKRMKLQNSKEDKRMRIQNGYSHWVSRICENWFRYVDGGRWAVK